MIWLYIAGAIVNIIILFVVARVSYSLGRARMYSDLLNYVAKQVEEEMKL